MSRRAYGPRNPFCRLAKIILADAKKVVLFREFMKYHFKSDLFVLLMSRHIINPHFESLNHVMTKFVYLSMSFIL